MIDWLLRKVFYFLVDDPEVPRQSPQFLIDSDNDAPERPTAPAEPLQEETAPRLLPDAEKFGIRAGNNSLLCAIPHIISTLPASLVVPDSFELKSPVAKTFQEHFGLATFDEAHECLDIFEENAKPILQIPEDHDPCLVPLPISYAASSTGSNSPIPSTPEVSPRRGKRKRRRMNHAMEEIIELSPFTVLPKRMRDHPPDNEELSEKLIRVLQKADLTTTNMAKVYEKICIIYSPHDMSRRKPFMKSVVRSFMLEKFKEAEEKAAKEPITIED